MSKPEVGIILIRIEVLNKNIDIIKVPYQILNKYLSKKYKNKYYHQEENKDEI